MTRFGLDTSSTSVGQTGCVRGTGRSRLQRTADALLAVFVGVFLLAVILDPSHQDDSWLVLGLCLLAVGQAVALLWRWSHPLHVTAVAVVAGLPIQLYAPDTLFPAAGLVALFALAATRPPRISLPALVALLGLTALATAELPAGDIGFGMAVAAGVWALGEAARNRHKAIAESTRRAVGEEQARLARELHDVIAHSVSVIVVQAAAADDVFDERPDQARAALRSIESAGREALGELRRLLAPVRGRDDDGPRAPQPGLARLDELVAPLRAAGLAVEVRRHDAAAGPLPAGVDLSAYRIVQEALTNTLRHAGAGRAEVSLRARDGALELEVVDDGAGAAHPSPGSGRGIAGMRERAALVGGTLDAGPLPGGGGFRVHAVLPLEAPR